MVYLFIMFSVASVGIATLWIQQKRERAHLESSQRFLASLQKIAPSARPPSASGRPGAGRVGSATPMGVRRRPAARSGRSIRLDATRREAARGRVEARRRAERRLAGSRVSS